MSSGNHRSVYGAVPGTGALLNVKTIGFRPKEVKLFNVAAGGLVTMEWLESMPDDSAFKESIAGAKTFPLTDGVIPLADGFSIGADADMNVADEVIHFVARG